MKRRLFVCFLALTMLLSLTACGASSKTAASVDSSANDHPAESPAVTEEKGYFDADTNGYDDEGRDSGGGVLENQKIIYTGDINLETTEFDEAVKALASLAEAKGGYLESSTVGGGSRGYRWADYTVRVPSAQFQSFLDQAGELAHVTWRNTNLENITETYYDTAGRLKTQQIKLERLQKLLAQAENMEDIITIESAISETEWNIEDLSGTLRHYDALVDFWSQFDPYTMNTLLVGDAMAQILKLEEMQDSTAGLAFQGTGKLVTPMGATLLRSSAVPSGTIIGLDRQYALELVRGSEVLVEYDKLIDRQLERAAITSISGFAKVFQPASKVLQIGTAGEEG